MSRRARWLDYALAVLVSIGALAVASSALAGQSSIRTAELDSQPDEPLLSPGRQSPRIVFVSGVVDATDKDLFGRPQKVAIVSLSDTGALVQNPIENKSAGEQLRHHVGEDVTARGVVLVKADGSMSLVVDAFQIHGQEGGFVGETSHSRRAY